MQNEERNGYIVLDFETTGLLGDNPEVLQVSVINENGEVLISSNCRPEKVTEWKEAEAVHGISPEMVAGCPTFREILPKLIEIIESASAILAYNAAFERGVLRYYGIEPVTVFVDPMLMFSAVYGDWNEYFQDYRWQTLGTAASYYGYEFKAHDALEDVRATLHVYKQMIADGVPTIII